MFLQELTEPSEVGPIKRWIYGVGVAAVPVAFGLWCLARGSSPLMGRHRVIHLTGVPGFMLGLAYTSVGAFLHFHSFWSSRPRFARAAHVAKIVCLAAFGAGLGYAIYWVVVCD